MAPAPNCRILGVVMSVGNLPVLQERLESVRSNAVAGSQVRIANLEGMDASGNTQSASDY